MFSTRFVSQSTTDVYIASNLSHLSARIWFCSKTSAYSLEIFSFSAKRLSLSLRMYSVSRDKCGGGGGGDETCRFEADFDANNSYFLFSVIVG